MLHGESSVICHYFVTMNAQAPRLMRDFLPARRISETSDIERTSKLNFRGTDKLEFRSEARKSLP